ncbi:PP2C family serine/threonine-protein phosphatase [Nocardioides sp. SYSU D00038]|uniref:PP2C family protein-serine/threonine phosphatase n=1 Tax=Nocardioides sp. SYSU D00038 TaxID=2812554 RepID=UPI00196772E2|nr:protein phosphatase 2C domain-containing protein [Nocardioides sp. SYSU D00038]
MTQVELHHGATTDVGRVREQNEDAFLVAPPVFLVADGMGGHDRGDAASRIVVEEFAGLAESGYDAVAARDAVTRTLDACQRRLEEFMAEARAGGSSDFVTATTAVGAFLAQAADCSPVWLVMNLGDSRAYRLHDRRLQQVSTDHSLVQDLVESGELSPEQAPHFEGRNVVTRSLGGTGRGTADFHVLPVAEAERLLLCSDGVSGMIDDAEIERILLDTGDPRDAADRLVAAAVAAGGLDNATAVVVDVVGLVADSSYDSEQQRASLEQKLGVLP